MMDSMTSAREAIGRLDVTIAVAFGLIALPLTFGAAGEPVDSN